MKRKLISGRTILDIIAGYFCFLLSLVMYCFFMFGLMRPFSIYYAYLTLLSSLWFFYLALRDFSLRWKKRRLSRQGYGESRVNTQNEKKAAKPSFFVLRSHSSLSDSVSSVSSPLLSVLFAFSFGIHL